jgi:hypothetical protein
MRSEREREIERTFVSERDRELERQGEKAIDSTIRNERRSYERGSSIN